MDHPSQLLNRIRRRKARPALSLGSKAPRRPAPAAPIAPTSPAPAEQAVPIDRSAPVLPGQSAPNPGLTTARPAGSHALYSEVMRRHDRMGTRHL